MRSRYRVTEPDGIYFVTATIIQWIPVFIGSDACDIITQSLKFCRQSKGLRLYAYVVMDNHVHLIGEAPELPSLIQSFKRHTAREIIRLAETTGKTWLLNQFEFYKRKGKDESRYQVWQEGVHPELIGGKKMLEQKIEYVHQNPVRRGYVEAPEHWRYSSARNFYLGDNSLIEIDPEPA